MAQKTTNKSTTGVPGVIIRFVKEARDELKKVAWPAREDIVRYTIIVIIASLAVGGIIGGIDYLFTLALERLIL